MVGEDRAQVVDGAEACEDTSVRIEALVANSSEIIGNGGAIVGVLVEGKSPGVDESSDGHLGGRGDARVVDVNVGEQKVGGVLDVRVELKEDAGIVHALGHL